MKRTLLLVLTVFTNILIANAEPITKARALSIATKYINNPKTIERYSKNPLITS